MLLANSLSDVPYASGAPREDRLQSLGFFGLLPYCALANGSIRVLLVAPIVSTNWNFLVC